MDDKKPTCYVVNKSGEHDKLPTLGQESLEYLERRLKELQAEVESPSSIPAKHQGVPFTPDALPEGHFTNALSLEDIRAAKPERIYYGATTCWWTHDPTHLEKLPNGLPCDPRGGVLFMTDDVEGFLEAAEDNPEHYGKHGLETFMAAHHQNMTRSRTDGRPWCFRTWNEYSTILDKEGKSGE